MADLKPGDIRDFWGYGPCVILEVTDDNYYVFNNFGYRDLLSKTMEYKSVKLDKEHREALYDYYLTFEKLGKANAELSDAQRKVRTIDRLLYDKGEAIAKKYGDLSYEEFLERIKKYGKEHFEKLESFGYRYKIEEDKEHHSLRLELSLCRRVKCLRQDPDYIKADYDDSALIIETNQYHTDMKKYSEMYCVELANTLSTNALLGKVHKTKKLEMTVGPLSLLHGIVIYTPFIHYTDKTAKAVADLFKTK